MKTDGCIWMEFVTTWTQSCSIYFSTNRGAVTLNPIYTQTEAEEDNSCGKTEAFIRGVDEGKSKGKKVNL